MFNRLSFSLTKRTRASELLSQLSPRLSWHLEVWELVRSELGWTQPQRSIYSVTVRGDGRKHPTHTHKPELALTSLNVNIYYLCTDHDTSDAPCWLPVCESECRCVYVFVFTGFKCSFFCRGMWLGETLEKAEKSRTRTYGPPPAFQPDEEGEIQEL